MEFGLPLGTTVWAGHPIYAHPTPNDHGRVLCDYADELVVVRREQLFQKMAYRYLVRKPGQPKGFWVYRRDVMTLKPFAHNRPMFDRPDERKFSEQSPVPKEN